MNSWQMKELTFKVPIEGLFTRNEILDRHWYFDQYFLYWGIERTEIKCVFIL